MLKVHQEIILSNLSVLVEETDLRTLVPELVKRKVFNNRMVDRILNPSHNVKRQKTDLYVEILKRGPQAFATLQEALVSSNHLNLAETLRAMESQEASQIYQPSSLISEDPIRSGYSSDNGNESDGPCQSTQRKISSDRLGGAKRPDSFPDSLTANPGHSGAGYHGHWKSELSKTVDLNMYRSNYRDPKDKVFNLPAYRIKILDEDLRVAGALTPEDKVIYTVERNFPVIVKCSTHWQQQTVGRPRLYKMDSNPRGYALIVNNMKFEDSEEYPDRVGSDNDELRLQQLLVQLHFEVEAHRNKTKREMEEIVETFTKKSELEFVDCVWVTFMSHGQDGDTYEDSEIIGVDGLGYKTSDIVSRFYNDSCRFLIDKPKIFFFQACRGCLTDPGVSVGYITMNFSERITNDGRRVRLYPQNVKIRTQSDIFIAYPSPGGIKANRDRITGAWFIQKVVDVFSEFAWNTHLEDLLKMVDEKIKRVNNLYTLNFQAVTTKSIGWNKHLYFNPGLCRDQLTGATIFIRTENKTSSPSDAGNEGMDVVDASSSSNKSPNGTTYSRLKDTNDEETDSDGGKYECLNLSMCKTS